MDKKDEFSAEHIQPQEDLELQQRYSNRDVSSKAQMYVQKKKGRGTTSNAIISNCSVKNSPHNRALFPSAGKSGVLTKHKKRILQLITPSPRSAPLKLQQLVCYSPHLARGKGKFSGHGGALEATGPNKRPLADGTFFATHKLHL